MKIIFAGSPTFAVDALDKMLSLFKERGINSEVVAVVTQPDKPVGRKRVLTPTPVKAYAQSLGLPVYDWAKIREHVDELKAIGADMMITCAYGQLLPESVISTFRRGIWNIHASLLPKYRGASPIQSAILAGETHTGVTVMKTELALDAGDILLVKRMNIENMSCEEVEKKLAILGGEAITEGVGLFEETLAKLPQDATDDDFYQYLNLLVQDESSATFCKKISKADAKINWADGAKEIVNKINAFNPDPVAWCNFGGTFNIYSASVAEGCGKAGEVIQADKKGVVVACGNGAVSLLVAQPAGGKPLKYTDLVNGRKIKVGDLLD